MYIQKYFIKCKSWFRIITEFLYQNCTKINIYFPFFGNITLV